MNSPPPLTPSLCSYSRRKYCARAPDAQLFSDHCSPAIGANHQLAVPHRLALVQRLVEVAFGGNRPV